MDQKKIDSFTVIGISVRTTNENGQSSRDIPALWGKFMAEGIAGKIPNKTNGTMYCIYTNYEKDHTKPYTTILGCRVEHTDTIPEGMVATKIGGGHYTRFVAKGNLMQGLVFNEWLKIWEANLDRSFSNDFEVYGEKAQNPEHAEVEIFVAVN